MAEKETRLNTIVVNKHDTVENWANSTYVPQQGQIVVIDGSTANIKIGNGQDSVKDLKTVTAAVETSLGTTQSSLRELTTTVEGNTS